MKNLLFLSYYDLPYYLKYCFLYLSNFPEDVFIDKNIVIQLWIAEGFVRENNRQVKEEVAEAYLNESLHRNLIILAEKSKDGMMMRGFRVHDILREVIVSKSIEQNFTTIIATGKTQSLPTILDALQSISLTSLGLQWNGLVEDPLPFLQDLAMLAYLDLSKSYKGEGLCFKAKKFSKLKHLRIIIFEALKWIRIEEVICSELSTENSSNDNLGVRVSGFQKNKGKRSTYEKMGFDALD
nr:disease resistance protein RPM1-like [Ipomoea batatas]